MKHSEAFWSILKHSEACWSILKHSTGFSRSVEDSQGFSRSVKDSQGFSRMLKDSQGCSGILKDSEGILSTRLSFFGVRRWSLSLPSFRTYCKVRVTDGTINRESTGTMFSGGNSGPWISSSKEFRLELAPGIRFSACIMGPRHLKVRPQTHGLVG